jgi:hypothetical protein
MLFSNLQQMERFFNFKSLIGKIDINSPDAAGRTALHHAALGKQKDCYRILLSQGAKEDIQDNMGFTPFECTLNPPPFYTESPQEDLDQYRLYVLSEKSCYLPERTALVYIKRIEQINTFIAKNPELNRIGFIVCRPNVLKRLKIKEPGQDEIFQFDDHVAGVYFHRHNGKEYLIQLDSLSDKFFLLPTSTNEKQMRYFIYSYLPRQTSGSGCFEDAITVLLKLIKIPGNSFIRFCTQESNREQLRLTQTREIALQVRYYEKMDMGYIKCIFRLKSFPEYMLPHIEYYGTMRQLRIAQPELFLNKMNPYLPDSSTYLNNILNNGCLRFPGVTAADIHENLQNPDIRFDFKGKNFSEREREFVKFRQAMQNCIYTLFKNHMHRKYKVNGGDIAKKMQIIQQATRNSISINL